MKIYERLGHTSGGRKTRTYIAWRNMISRCTNPKYAQFSDYGGRGITVCSRWRSSFGCFLEDMGICAPGLSLDRYPNNNGNYEPGNCRWATRNEQAQNTRTSFLITFNGQTKALSEWSRTVGIRADTIRYRIVSGWSVDHALTLPPSSFPITSRLKLCQL